MKDVIAEVTRLFAVTVVVLEKNRFGAVLLAILLALLVLLTRAQH